MKNLWYKYVMIEVIMLKLYQKKTTIKSNNHVYQILVLKRKF